MQVCKDEYIARKPGIAKTMDVSMIKRSVVTAKMAGIESTASTRSTIPVRPACTLN